MKYLNGFDNFILENFKDKLTKRKVGKNLNFGTSFKRMNLKKLSRFLDLFFKKLNISVSKDVYPYPTDEVEYRFKIDSTKEDFFLLNLSYFQLKKNSNKKVVKVRITYVDKSNNFEETFVNNLSMEVYTLKDIITFITKYNPEEITHNVLKQMNENFFGRENEKEHILNVKVENGDIIKIPAYDSKAANGLKKSYLKDGYVDGKKIINIDIKPKFPSLIKKYKKRKNVNF